VPWNPRRVFPWKRLATFEAMYAGLFAAFVLIFQRTKPTGSLIALGGAVVLTTVAIYVLFKFGWDPAFLKSRTDLAQIRADRIAARQAARDRKAGKPAPAPERYRPAPTKRTSAGPTNRPRRTRDQRKR